MKNYFLITSILLAQSVSFALKPIPPIITFLAKTEKGFHLQLEKAPTPQGGRYIQYEILDRKKRVVKSFPVSDTRFDSKAPNGDIHGEKISEETCRSNLKELGSELKKLNFKKVTLTPDECGKKYRNFDS
jgi:hypothetical protein